MVERRTDCQGKISLLLNERIKNHKRTKIRYRLAACTGHAGRVLIPFRPFFYRGTWFLNNAVRSDVAEVIRNWLDMWFMPLFFLLSGFGSWYALRSRSNGQYLMERVKRILVDYFFCLVPQYKTL